MPSQYSLGTSFRPQELTLPSHTDPNDPSSPHNVVLVRRIDPQSLIGSGFLNKLDVLTALVDERHIAPKRPKQNRKAAAKAVELADDDPIELLRKFAANNGDINAALGLIDWLVEMCVVEPKVRRPVLPGPDGTEIPLPPSDRDPAVIYTDIVDLDDKNAIVAWALEGVNSLKPFRDGGRKSVVNVEAV